MSTKIIHNELVEQTADLATLAPLQGFQSQGSDFMLIATPAVNSPGSAINLDTGTVVAVNTPNVVTLLDLSITITDTPAPAAPAAPASP